MTWTPSSEEGAFNVHKEVEAFLSRHQMHFDLIDWNGETRFLAKQMKAGLEGVPSSLMMIPSFVMLKRQIPAGEKTIVVDAGGTNLRVVYCVLTAKRGRLRYRSFKNSQCLEPTGR